MTNHGDAPDVVAFPLVRKAFPAGIGRPGTQFARVLEPLSGAHRLLGVGSSGRNDRRQGDRGVYLRATPSFCPVGGSRRVPRVLWLSAVGRI
jgi:hypothetical protein